MKKTPIEILDELILDTRKAYAGLEAEVINRQRELQQMQSNLIATTGAIQGFEAAKAKLLENQEPQCLPEPAPSDSSTT